jgi:general transcription factor 3C polypeptide 3 (transcription factor C subunit 4)
MAAARDLVDDFRSFRRFYTWDKYVKYLGAANDMVFNAPYQVQSGTSELHQFAERLSRSMNPPPIYGA